VVLSVLTFEPRHELAHAMVERDFRSYSSASRAGECRRCGADIPGRKASELGLDIGAELPRKHIGHLEYRGQRPGPEIQGEAVAARARVRTTPETMSDTWTKSRLCRQSSKMTGGGH
jgi:hypothetical protein